MHPLLQLTLEHFITPKSNPTPLSHDSKSPILQDTGNTNLCSIFIELLTVDMSHKWNHEKFEGLCEGLLSLSTLFSRFIQVRSCHSLFQISEFYFWIKLDHEKTACWDGSGLSQRFLAMAAHQNHPLPCKALLENQEYLALLYR